jgi:integrase
MARGLGHVYQRGQIWWIKYYVDGEPRFESSESKIKGDAVRLLKQRLGKPVVVKTHNLSVQDLIDGLLAFSKQHRPKSHETFTVPVAKHISRELGAVRAKKVSQTILSEYIRTRQEQGAANASINKELGILKRAYNLARIDRRIDADIIPKFPRLEENNSRQGFLEPEQYARLLEVIPDDLKPALVVGYHTGLRKSKVLGLRLDQFDLKHRHLRLDPNENAVKKTPLLVPLYGEFYTFAEKHIRETREKLPGCNHFCHRANGDPVMELRPAWDDATEAAGLKGLLFHDLRRSAVRNMERAGVPRSVAMKISGHKTESVYRRYDIVSEKDVEEAGKKLAKYLERKPNSDSSVTVAGSNAA